MRKQKALELGEILGQKKGDEYLECKDYIAEKVREIIDARSKSPASTCRSDPKKAGLLDERCLQPPPTDQLVRLDPGEDE